MKRNYLYLIFVMLAGIVVVLVLLLFKTTKATPPSVSNLTINSNPSTGHLELLKPALVYKNSWMEKISQEQQDKTYLYPVSQWHKEFN